MTRKHIRGQGTLKKRGKWFHVYYSIDGVSHRESAKTQIEEEARAYLAKKIGAKYSGAPIVPGSIRIRELFRLVQHQYELEERASTYIAALKIRKHLEKPFGNLKASDLTTTKINGFIAKRKREGAAPATINREIALIRRGFTLGLRHDPPLVARVPTFPELDESSNVRRGFLAKEKYRDLLAELPDELKLLLVLGYHVGMRRGALLRIRWEWVDLIVGVIRFEEAASRNKKRVARIIPIFGDMREYIEKQPRESEMLFARSSKPIKDFRAAWKAACARAGVPELLFHDLRRSAAKNMRRARIPESIIMTLTGHKTRAMLERYLIEDEEEQVDVGKRIERFLKGEDE